MRVIGFAACSTIAAFVSACGSAAGPAPHANGREGWPTGLTFAMGVNPEADETAMLHKPIVERIQKATGLPVRFFKGTSFSSVVEAMRAKRIDGMETGVFSYMLAEKVADAEAVAVYISTTAVPAVYDSLLQPGYNGLIITRKGSGIRSIEDLRGRTLVFGDPAGTSDHLVPKNELIKHGLTPDEDVKTTFSGNHSSAIMAVAHGKAPAAATAEPALKHYAAGLRVQYCGFPDSQFGRAQSPAALKALFEACPDGRLVPIHSAPIPGTPFALRGDLPDDLKAVIRESLLSTPQDPAFIREAKKWYVDPSVELKLPNIFAYYDTMREMARLLDLDLTRMQ
jgi:phosphonate transport system substrate-binding protein